MESSPADIAQLLGEKIPEELLRQAMTHRSFAYENGGIPDNERLEFLGDAVLGKVITLELFQRFPDLDEGELAVRRSRLVSTEALAELARRVNLGQYLLLGNGEELTGGREKSSLLADAMEAVFGALFLASGEETSAEFILGLMEPMLADETRFGEALDPKTSLQELAARIGFEQPRYEIEASGPDHNRRFTARVTFADRVYGTGSGTSKKRAELAAALEAWRALSAEHDGAESGSTEDERAAGSDLGAANTQAE